MTPKLTRPFILQPVANGVAMFPLELASDGKMDFSKIRIFTQIEASYDYPQNPEKLLGFIRELVENGEIPLDNGPQS